MTTDTELRELLAKATPGPWRHYGMAGVAAPDVEIVYEGPVECEECDQRIALTGCLTYADAELIAAAVNALPGLLDERDHLRQGGKELGKSLLFWMELARKVTDSDDVIEEDGDGDWAVVAERLAALGDRAEAAEAEVARPRTFAADLTEEIEQRRADAPSFGPDDRREWVAFTAGLADVRDRLRDLLGDE